MLYLPSLWYHQVSQVKGNNPYALAINYWFDMEFTHNFSLYETCRALRNLWFIYKRRMNKWWSYLEGIVRYFFGVSLVIVPCWGDSSLALEDIVNSHIFLELLLAVLIKLRPKLGESLIYLVKKPFIIPFNENLDGSLDKHASVEHG